jgi:predicted esterase YcpF (UPF0227 family)
VAVLYLHGFNSSPASFKAQQLAACWQDMGLPAEQLHIPVLPNDPQQAIEGLELWMAGQEQDVLVVGSSLGGYYATWLAEKYGCKALLINPAVRPALRFQQYLGPQQNFSTGERWELTEQHVQALAALQTGPPQDAGRYWVWLQTGDETLDYREAEIFYRGCRLDIREGGDHGYQGFVARIPELLAFAGVT